MTAQWQGALRDFLADCGGSGAGEQADRLREGLALFAAAPEAMRPLFPVLPGKERLDTLLAAGAAESAALALVGNQVGYMLSRGPNGLAMASVVLPGCDQDQSASGATPALALLSALALALLGGLSDSAAARQGRGLHGASRLN